MIGKQMKMMNLLVACALPAALLMSCQDQSTELSVQSTALAAKDSGGERISHRNPVDRQLVKVPKAGTRPDYEPGIVLVRFTDPIKDQVNGALADSLGLSVERASRIGVHKMALRTAETVPQAVARLSKDPRVVYAEPNYRIQLANVPNDPRFAELWGMDNTGQTGGTPDADIDAVEAWDISIGSPDVIVAVLDTGVDYTHPDLVDNMWSNEDEIAGNGIDDDNNGYIDDVRGWDFENQTNDPMDNHSHGTHCSGTIGGSGNNNLGVTGVNWRVSIMPLRIIGNQDLESYCLDAAEAVIYAADNGAHVMSCSWWTVEFYSLTLENAVGYSDAAGVIMVAAAGNDSTDVESANLEVWPCEWAFDNTICVASTDHNDDVSYFSNWGAVSVDVAGPGSDILSSIWPGHGYDTKSGTSMATPHVAGTVALMMSIRPDLTPGEIKQFLFNTVDSLPGLQGITTTGGRINAYRALAAISGVPLPPTAMAGGDQTVQTGVTVVLDGSSSFDPNQDPITFDWDFYPPAHSSASLDDETNESPRFFADVCGEFQAELVVTDDGGLQSQTDRARVHVRNWSDVNPVIETSHPYLDNEDQTWTITQPGAVVMGLHFSSFDTESGWDFVAILDGSDTQWAVYDGGIGEFNTISVDGDTIKVHFTSDGSVTRDGFTIDGYWWCDAGNCPPGQGDCNDDPADGCETDTSDDVSNCGWCGHVCAFANASASCVGGVCQMGACDVGFTDCDGDPANGCEADLLADPANCGACDSPCGPYPNATPGCSGGTCEIDVCDNGWDDCNGSLVDGCESSVVADPNNCGACGVVCILDHATDTFCEDGECHVGDCTDRPEAIETTHPYLDDLDLNWQIVHPGATSVTVHFASFDTEANYDYVQLRDGADNLVVQYWGALGAFVSDPVPGDTINIVFHSDGSITRDGFLIDSSSSCATGCEAGWGDCDADGSNGCESDLSDDLANCGGCAVACGEANTDSQCSAGVCNPSTDCLPDWGDCDGDIGTGCESDLTGDNSNCGACGSACDFDHASGACVDSVCEMGTCEIGYGNCNNDPADGCESSVGTDPTNCGACGNACLLPHVDGVYCDDGVCQIGTCDVYPEAVESLHPYLDDTDQEWVISHPGAPALEVHFSMFDTELSYDYVDLYDGADVLVAHYWGNLGPFSSDPIPGDTVRVVFHSDSSITRQGFVIDWTRTCEPGGCAAGWFDCDGQAGNGCESDIDGDPNNCGGCGTVCVYDHADALCNSGSCAMGACDNGYDNCNGSAADGCETDIWGDGANCGACGNGCGPYDHANASCASGTCLMDCHVNWDDCNASQADGCESSVQSDPQNCGACGTVCAFDNASGTCNQGSCAMGACDAGYGDCNNHPVDGCESNLANDAANCGVCGTACDYPDASGVCVAGSCALDACDAGFANCDGSDANGCETVPNTDPNHCGGCGLACDLPGVHENACTDGLCSVGICDPDLADCDGVAGNGCEVVLPLDPDNCGACGTVCTLDNAVAGCDDGLCVVNSCVADFGNCDGLDANGCEAGLVGDPNNCGACGTVCGPYPNGSGACNAGACELTCDAGWADCNGDPADGCEVQLGAADNCSACGDDCTDDYPNADGTCADGACTMGACQAGFADCNTDPVDGCEGILGTDDDCAFCGDACADAFPNGSGSCQAGGCVFDACDAEFGDCDGVEENGCEVGLTGATDCGACGVACGAGEVCIQLVGIWSCSADCADVDNDGFADEACGGTDCDDTQAEVYPGAAETCNRVDDNCDGEIDEGHDQDGDGFTLCGDPADCDDADDTAYPGADEICDDGIDQDCSGADLPCECADVDEDGFADAACGGMDCDDANADVHPAATEVCDGLDNDCDGTLDFPAETVSCGVGVCETTVALCVEGQIQNCIPTEPSEATEVSCEDGLDNDCDGYQDAEDPDCGGECPDADDDGFTDAACGGQDCDDGNADVNPGADEICDDGLDNDCNGLIDTADLVPCPDDDSGGGGCGCASTSAAPAGAGFGLALLMGLIAVRRRRN